MAAATEREELLSDAQDLKSQNDLESDSDSGQGSCETKSPTGLNKGVMPADDGADSEEEIYVSKRIKSKKVLPDSDSEREDLAPEKLEVVTHDMGGTNDTFAAKEKKFTHSFPVLEDSNDSDTENLSPSPQLENTGKPEKKYTSHKTKQGDGGAKDSPRKRNTRKDKRRTSIRPMVKKEKPPEQEQEEDGVLSFNDSGCPLTDKDLFENGLEEDEELTCPDGQSLESIKAAARQKMRKQKLFSESEDYLHTVDENKESLIKEPRKERKAAKLSKEAMKYLHSESQRLLREAAVPLPYHVPEAKSIHEFFRRKPRPVFQGSAMTLLRSTKHHPGLDAEGAIPKKADIVCSESEPSAGEESGVRVDPPDPALLNPASGSAGGSSVERVENVTDCPVPNGQSRDSRTECPREETPPEKQDDRITAQYLQPPESKQEENGPEHREDPSPESCAGPEESTEPLATVVPVPSGKRKKSKLARLRELGVDLTIKPRLCSGDVSFVELEEPKSNRELESLKERFVKHALHAAKPKSERMVNLNIIRKETTNEGKEELKADMVPVVLPAEATEEATNTKPGEKLFLLKAKLQEAMKRRRMEERQRRQALFKLDNEEMMEEEEEEEEMTDESEEEDQEEEEEEEGNKEGIEFLLDEAEEDNEEVEEGNLGDDDKETDPESLDEEQVSKSVSHRAVLKPPSTESTLLLFKDNSSKTGCFSPVEKAETEEVKRPNKADDEDSFLLPNLAKDNSHNSSFELIGSMIPSYQPWNKQAALRGSVLSTPAAVRSPSPGFFKASFISSASKSSGKASEPSLPVEDSQDLYNGTPEEKSPVPASGSFRFQFSLEDDTQSQLLDADGFLNVGHQRNKYQPPPKNRLPLASMDENAMDANMDELLDLCSGQFTSQEKPSGSGHGRKPNMEELLNLCSGKFATQDSPIQASAAAPGQAKEQSMDDPMAEALALCSGSFPSERTQGGSPSKWSPPAVLRQLSKPPFSVSFFRRQAEEDEEEELEGFSLHAFDSDNDEESKGDEEEEEEGDEEEEEGEEVGESNVDDDDDEEEVLRRREGLKKKFKLQAFIEEEAELSGSDVPSEDEYDGEELDRYEEDDLDEVLPTTVELQDQVNKIHMKVMMDDDKRQLRLYQERYLEDGDLHSDGPGRTRRFRWKNIDDSSQMDMFHKDGDGDEGEDLLDESEAVWRKERFEREQWLREQSEKGEEDDIDENSQFMKLAKKVTAKSLRNKVMPTRVVQETKALARNPFEAFHLASNPKLKNGSLLNRPKAVLEKLAAMSNLNPNAPRNSRNFVFQTLSPVKTEESREKPTGQVIKKRAPAPIATPPPKRQCPDGPSVQETRSIFRFLER